MRNREPYILCIEDSVADSEMISYFFSHQASPLEVVVSCSGLDARGFLEKLDAGDEAQPPRFIVCDLNLPGWSGLEILNWFRTQPAYAGIPFFIFSTCSDNKIMAQALSEKADGYFVKPVDLDDFEKTIEAMYSRFVAMETDIAHLPNLAL